ncbi:hypothetical protein CEUSTIGMA_g3615.t1 [Chlamydomonas eustigma]|uniref:Uncharacterized protein n=1 Tax=Chlamydomonas eustigma TaxID=1157962 RepID=A0A250WZB4_9CHLO|nr:hypothetical protein CEUSTIGMA_g3615.t1 [Chlamydomonas eustigma]|eukprot:GAX76171.1 hypothetical protein CEUSTIGMA_g3615.t1 [Chlamydomonas eustigma]
MALCDSKRMPPPPPRLPVCYPKLVVDEEKYTSDMEAIIERDFFPDVPKMRSQLEWMQAIKSGDQQRIKLAQINIAYRRAGLKTPSLSENSSGGSTVGSLFLSSNTMERPNTGWSTPGSSRRMMSTPAMTPLPSLDSNSDEATFVASEFKAPLPLVSDSIAQSVQLRAPPMSLDSYLAHHTSEDNASFSKIIGDEQEKKRVKYSHHLNDKNKEQVLLLEGPSKIDEYGSSGQSTMTLAMQKHEPMNSLYYYKGEVALSDKEVSERAIGPPKAVVAKNTRLPMPDISVDPLVLPAARDAPNAVASGLRSRLDRLGTPSFTPGRDSFSPLMTWGELGSTPLRLDGVELDALELNLPTGAGTGNFQVQELGKREKVLHRLARSKGASSSRQPSPALTLLQQQYKSNTPMLSPAARSMLASKLKGKGNTPLSDRDDILRASYRNSGGSKTPLAMKVEKRAGSKSTLQVPLHDLIMIEGNIETANSKGTSHITDDLLNL